jgi:UDPglucose--hexose-1-phosphate uridylyltransferase
VAANDSFVACIPWFARYAYEVLILPRRPVASLPMLGTTERQDLAAVLLEVVRGYDRLWDITMPFVLAVHQAPTDGRPTDHFPCHVEIHPPLRRVDTLKYLAGPEIGGGTMTNESDPDEKAAELRAAVEAAKQAV